MSWDWQTVAVWCCVAAAAGFTVQRARRMFRAGGCSGCDAGSCSSCATSPTEPVTVSLHDFDGGPNDAGKKVAGAADRNTQTQTSRSP